uniref:Uncharacterized protein n=1 Tax=Physcomitrium patens TaxID=3218 RepID=A0A2K1JG61_PHYPA|nr:hypothetical protein PHYPA_017932 [Physcomitrium patens]
MESFYIFKSGFGFVQARCLTRSTSWFKVAKTRHVIEAVEKTSFKDLLKSEHVSVSRTTRLFQARQSVRIYFESSANEPCLKYADLSSDSSCTCSV